MSVINQKLVDYVQNALRQGHDLSSIKGFLLKNNVSLAEVDEVIGFFSKQSPKSGIVKPTNLDDQLSSYVASQLRNGYSLDSIRQGLVQQGFSQIIIGKVLSVYGDAKPASHSSGKAFIWIFLGLIIFGGLAYTVFYTDLIISKDLPVLDASIEANKYSYNIGESINYNIDLSSANYNKNIDASIKYSISDSTGKIRKTYSEKVIVNTKTSSNGKISLDGLGIGIYSLLAVVDYGGTDSAQSSVGFEIINPTSSNPGTTSIINNPNTNPSSTNPNNNPSSTDYGHPGIVDNAPTDTYGDAILQLKTLAKSNPASAASNCAKFSSQTQRDGCYGAVADASGKSSYCESIKSLDYSDGCYIAFVLKGNNQACDKIHDNTTKSFCDQLTIVNQMNAYYQQGKTDMVVNLTKKFKPDIYNSNIRPPTYETISGERTTYTVMDINTQMNVTGAAPEAIPNDTAIIAANDSMMNVSGSGHNSTNSTK